ncbi:MAG TPA: Asp-tRNA(Asn)/Glu-tRNA(Gln) amidotransferase subunit GatB [Actinomycetota bacterium]|nr:Asp-tRNA(Asn)/Glu-tRNA(Gln) amidotransferase subunit GatB [Actinomycetota bacterium]
MTGEAGAGLGQELITTIGLEIHVELATRTKMFCGCPVAFGGEPNTRVCQVCLGHPGTLPVPNAEAIAYAAKIGMALGCAIAPSSIFHRKNYFYPDMPKNYQISQYDIPLCTGGAVAIETDGVPAAVGITRVHLEEDTGKSLHMGGGGRIHGADYSLEDFNRAGTPLVEIVTEPDMHSADQARAFATELRATLEALEVSDIRMEEGSMRFDANISMAPPGRLGAKVEVKNLNSLRSLHRALAYEEQRQREVLGDGGTIEQSTRHWDERAGVTRPLRTKEHAFDYRYFPEPDLVAIEPPADWLESIAASLPELPAARRRRFEEQFGLSAYDAGVLVASRPAAAYFEAAVAAGRKAEPKEVANWLANDLVGLLTKRGESIEACAIPPEHLAELVDLVAGGEISRLQGREVLDDMAAAGAGGPPPAAIVEKKGLRQLSGGDELAAVLDEVIAANPDVWARLRAGDTKPEGFLFGQVMRATKGQANPSAVRNLLKTRLDG